LPGTKKVKLQGDSLKKVKTFTAETQRVDHSTLCVSAVNVLILSLDLL